MGKQKKEKLNDTRQPVIKSFEQYIQANGKRPRSYTEFCEVQKLKPEEAHAHYRTLVALEKAVWLHWFNETLSVLASSEEYKDYSARERLLSFYYTWMDTVKPFDDYMKTAPTLPKLFSGVDWFLADIQRAFLNYVKELVQLAAANGEIMKRPLVQNYYDNALWQQFLFIMNYRLKDKSEEKTKTDEAIERSVNLFFELAGRNQLDSILDFGKFLFKKN